LTTHLTHGERPSDASGGGSGEPAPIGTGSRGTRILGAAALLGVLALGLVGLLVSPEDRIQGDLVRILYVHVPSAMLAYVACGITTLGSAVYLWKKSRWWDLVAYSSAEIGAVFTGITLVTGMLWGRPTWGVYWVWDARLTSTAMLFLLLLGYLAVRRIPAAAPVRSKRAAIVGLLLVPNVVIVRQSVEWWRTLHQEATIFANGLESEIQGMMLFAWFLGVVVFGLIFAWLLIHRFRLAWLQEQIEEHGLETAIADRRAEADLDASPADRTPAAGVSPPTNPTTDAEAAR